MQYRFKIEEVDKGIMQKIERSPATAYCVAMQFQLGCAIGELIGMGVDPAALLETVDRLVEHAVTTRASGDTNKTDG
jgi:hypothetical protein